MMAAWVLAALALALIGFDSYGLWQDQRFNAALRRGETFEGYRPETARVQFARAVALHRQGKLRDALLAYSSIGDSASDEIASAVKFNLANLYIQQARELEAHEQSDLTVPLIELAKENYRDLLRSDSANWNAKYNLEVALSLLPEMEDVEAADEFMPERSQRAAASTDVQRELP